MPAVKIIVGRDDFDAGAELRRVHNVDPKIGAACSFVGYVRDFGDGSDIVGIEVEHYPGMTEKALRGIAEEACNRWSLASVVILHRTGYLKLTEQIVMVVCASAHRKAAFSGCEFIMDFLKVRAPFWKKEFTSASAGWVEAKTSDLDHAQDWSCPAKTDS